MTLCKFANEERKRLAQSETQLRTLMLLQKQKPFAERVAFQKISISECSNSLNYLYSAAEH